MVKIPAYNYNYKDIKFNILWIINSKGKMHMVPECFDLHHPAFTPNCGHRDYKLIKRYIEYNPKLEDFNLDGFYSFPYSSWNHLCPFKPKIASRSRYRSKFHPYFFNQPKE